MSQFRDAYGEFRRLGIEVVSMSVDSPYCHLAWARQLHIEYPMVSDFNRDVLPLYDALGPGSAFLKNSARRTAHIIDSELRIRYAWSPPPEGGLPPVGEILDHAQRMLLEA